MIQYFINDLKKTISYLPICMLSGIVFFIIGYILIWALRKTNKNTHRNIGLADFPKPGHRPFYIGIFGLFLAYILQLVLLSREMGTVEGIDLTIFGTLHDLQSPRLILYYIENIILFVPLTFLYGLAFPEISATAIPLSFLFSVGIECVQLALKCGYFQVDDIIANTIGAVIGFLFFRMIRSIHRMR